MMPGSNSGMRVAFVFALFDGCVDDDELEAMYGKGNLNRRQMSDDDDE
jgi:hypothetical protein